MADAAGIAAITGAASVLSGVVGYLGARLQHHAERDRIGVEKERLKLERAERLEERGERAVEVQTAIYLDLVREVERAWFLSQTPEVVTNVEINEWWVTYQDARRKFLIAAPDSVVDLFYEELDHQMVAVADDLYDTAKEAPALPDNYNRRLKVSNKFDSILMAARANLDRAIREHLAIHSGREVEPSTE